MRKTPSPVRSVTRRKARARQAFTRAMALYLGAGVSTLALFVFGQAYRASHHVLPDTPGIVSWHTLAQVGTTQEKGKPAPLFSAAVKALDHTRVNVRGFIVPLESGDEQRHFILSARPPSCPFCLPGGPEEMIEVFSTRPVAYTEQPIVVSGGLQELTDESDGLIYRLDGAAQMRK